MVKKVLLSPYFICLLITLAFLSYFFGDILYHPNDYLITWIGDGKKNYFTYLYHVKHDPGYLQFEGMNYPFGEYIIYPDNQPLFSGIAKLLGIHSVGFHNTLLFLNIIATVLISVSLLKKLKLSIPIVIAGALTFGLLAPQLHRIVGHYALSYSFFFPLLLLLIYKVSEQNKWLDHFWMLLINFCMYFTHTYLGAMGSIMIVCYHFFHLINHVRLKKDLISTILKMVLSVSAVAFFVIINQLLDCHENRTSIPLGFFHFTSSIANIFLPAQGPLADVLMSLLGDYSSEKSIDAFNYPGLYIILGFFISAIGLVIKHKAEGLKKLVRNPFLMGLILMSIISFCIAITFPFNLDQERWRGNMGAFGQLRGTGRFAWIFFYSFGLISLVLLQKFILNIAKGWRAVFLLSLSVILLSEIKFYQDWVRERIDEHLTANLFDPEEMPEYYEFLDTHINPAEYSCLISFPYYHTSSEVVDIYLQDESMSQGMLVSQYTGIPMVNIYSARVSFDETRMAINLMTSKYTPKQIKNHFKDERKILIIEAEGFKTEFEETLLSESNFIASQSKYGIRISEVSFEGLFLERALPDESDTAAYFENFNTEANGHLKLSSGEYHDIAETRNLQKGKLYDVSFWVNYAHLKYADVVTMVSEWQGDEEIQKITNNLRMSCYAIIKDWARVNVLIYAGSANSRFIITVLSQNLAGPQIEIDNLLIREYGSKVIHEDFLDANYKMINNNFTRPMAEY